MIKKWKSKLARSSWIQSIVNWSKNFVLPGFDGLPIYYVATFFVNGLRNGNIGTKASSIAFKFFLALFPTIIFLVTLIPIIPIENFQLQLLTILNDLLPTKAYQFAEATLIEIFTTKKEGLLSFGFLFALYLATNGLDGMLTAFKDSYHSHFKRNAIRQQLLAAFLLFILTILVIVAIAAIVVSEYLTKFIFEPGDFSSMLLIAGKWFIIILLCFFGISTLYYYGGKRGEKWRFFSAGSTLGTILVLLVSLIFGFYVDNFANYNKFYGSIGAMIIVMIWIYINSFVLLIGFELNASIRQAGTLDEVEKKIEKEAEEVGKED